jgi:hypothetical protein
MTCRTSTRVFAVAALAAGALAASVAENLVAAPQPLPSPLARDEEFVVRLSRPVPFSRVLDGNLRVTSRIGAETIAADGTWVQGRALIDPSSGRAVVVRPEAVREYFQLVKGLPRVDAQTAAEKLLTRVERTGNLRPLDDVDSALRVRLGPLAGSRLDDPNVDGFYPPTDGLTAGTSDYRRLVAGDDADWRAYFSGGDIGKYEEMSKNPEAERFYGTNGAEPVAPTNSSVMSRRAHRRVLVRRSPRFLTFMPSIPVKADLRGSGYVAGASYLVTAGGPLRGAVRTLLPARGGALRFVRGLALFHVEADSGDGGPLLGGTTWTGAPSAEPPRVVNVTPPDGETDIDPTTDWEAPDNQYTTPLPQRRPFVVRLRFAAPLDPRTVDVTHVTLTKTAVVEGTGVEFPVHVPVAIHVSLSQTRLGEIRVDVTPASNLEPESRYEVRVLGGTRALDGHAMDADFVSTFVAPQ